MAQKLPRGYYWRGGIVWFRTDPLTGKPASSGCKTFSAAKLRYEARERLAADPHYAAATQATVGRWITETLKHKKSRGKADGTLHMYNVKFGHVRRIFGVDAPMATITPAAVDQYIEQRQSESAASNTIARELTCLRQMLRLARRAGEYNLSPSDVMPVGFAAEYVPVTRTLAHADLPGLMAALRNDDERAWVALALAFAADESDIHRMRPEDYDEARGLFHVRGTKNRARDAWLPVFVGVESEPLRTLGALFDFALPRLPVTWLRASKGVGEACARAKIGHLSPKDLRRTTITWLAEAGVEQAITSRFARHLGDQMVRKVYAQIAPRTLGDLIVRQAGRGVE